MTWNIRTPTFILSFTLLVMMLGYGMVLPIIPFYIEQFGAGGRELGWMMSMYSLMQLIFAPIWGVLSDRYGRKGILSIGIMGYAISLLFFGLATNFWMLFLARTLSGILSSATMPTAMAYIGDNTPEKERSGKMGQLGAMTGVGVVIGPLLGGLLSTNSLSFPFFIGAGLALIAFVLVITILPESRSQQSSSKQSGVSFGILREIFVGPIGILLLLIFVMSFGLTAFQGITGLYVIDKFAFDTRQVGSIWMVMGATMIAVQGAFTGPLTRRLGEPLLIRIGLVGGSLGFLGMTRAVDYLTSLLALGAFTAALALISPALNAHISTYAGERQGTIMGMNSAATSLGRVAGPLWAGYLYEIDIDYPFLSGAMTLGLGLLISFIGTRRQVDDMTTRI
ncbi:MAG: MFS transporter [Leptolinea sp.]|nr:MFS transporter [Leptolinea sp.]